MKTETAPIEVDETWKSVRPLLDEALAKLRPREQDALILRYLANHDWEEVGLVLGLSEEAARQRVQHALERLCAVLARHGLEVSPLKLAAALAARAVEPMPGDLAETLVAMASGKAPVPPRVAALVKATLRAMWWARFRHVVKVALAVLVGVGALVAAVVGVRHAALERRVAPAGAKQPGISATNLEGNAKSQVSASKPSAAPQGGETW